MEFGQVPKQLFTTPHPARFGAKVSPALLSVDGAAKLPPGDELKGRQIQSESKFSLLLINYNLANYKEVSIWYAESKVQCSKMMS